MNRDNNNNNDNTDDNYNYNKACFQTNKTERFQKLPSLTNTSRILLYSQQLKADAIVDNKILFLSLL